MVISPLRVPVVLRRPQPLSVEGCGLTARA